MHQTLAERAGLTVDKPRGWFNGWYYLLFTLVLPFGLMLLLFPSIVNNSPLWAKVALIFVGLPLFINVAFGPSIFAFWHKKKSRRLILSINILVTIASISMGGIGIPGFLIWIWAFKGRKQEGF